ncbi:MAG: hypothetical protein AB7P49_21545 [Bdellovibrionales bacterium]
MRAGMLLAMLAVFLMGWSASPLMAQQKADADLSSKADKQSASWWSRLNPFHAFAGKKAPADSKVHNGTKVESQGMDKTNKPSITETAAAIQQREEEILFRRQAVCDKLRAIAMQTGDDNLLRKAEQLDQRAWQVYLQKTQNLATGTATLQEDERLLTERLGGDWRTDAAGLNGATSSRDTQGSSGRIAARKDGR